MYQEKVSVALATWNGEQYLAEQLESIAVQTKQPFEVIISDDNSSDGTVEIARKFREQMPYEVTIIANSERKGYPANFFTALRACRGDVIAMCDQDDLWHPDKLAATCGMLQACPAVTLVCHSARVVDESLRDLGWRAPGYKNVKLIPPGGLRPFAGFPGLTTVFRSKLLEALSVEPLPVSAMSGGTTIVEHDVWASLVGSALGSVALLPDDLVLYRRHSSNTAFPAPHHVSQHVRPTLPVGCEANVLEELATRAAERAVYLERLYGLAQTLGGEAVGGISRSSQAYAKYSKAAGRRASLYRASTNRMAIRQLGSSLWRGDYTRRRLGGLGLRSLVRDIAIGLARRRQR